MGPFILPRQLSNDACRRYSIEAAVFSERAGITDRCVPTHVFEFAGNSDAIVRH
jgi:hypothetical protein